MAQLQESFASYPVYFSLLLVSIFAVYIKLIKGRKNKRKLNLPPSPPKLPLIGNLHQCSKLLHHSLRDLAKKYGPDLMLMQLGQTQAIIVSSADMAREMMKTNDAAFCNRPQAAAAKIHFYNCESLSFAPYGEYWRQIKKISMLELLTLRRVQSFQYVREEEIKYLNERLYKAAREGSAVNLTELVILTSNNIVAKCTFGKKFDEENGRSRIGELARVMLEQFSSLCISDVYPSLSWIDDLRGVVKRMKKTHEEFDEFFDQVIEEHRMMKNHNTQNSDKMDFVDILLDLQREGDRDFRLTDVNMKGIIMDMLVGGSDSASTLVEWAMAELIKNQKKMKKAQEEIRGLLGKKTKISLDDINNMPYVEGIVKESLRLHPPGPLLSPRLTITDVKMGGYDLPANTRVIVNAYAIQRDPKLWENPEEFIPERFLETQLDYKGQDHYKLIPFGGGRRICPGMSFATIASKYFLVNFLHWFDWKLPHESAKFEDLDMNESPGLSVAKKIPLIVKPVPYYP